MPFKITARTILELGAELISSDGTALYELIKNCIDAGSETVEVNVVVTMTHTHYDMALEYISRFGNDASFLNDARERILGYLGDDAPKVAFEDFKRRISKPRNLNQLESALTEAYEACNYIQIKDTGHGMSLAELDDIYLTIGTRSRRKEKSFMADKGLDFEDSPATERVYLGDKGVGRLSAMRLGDRLVVETTRSGDPYWNVLNIDWEAFSHDLDDLVEDIRLEPIMGKEKPKKAIQGTIVMIRRLKSDWTEGIFNSVIESDFARMVDPFEPKRGNKLLKLFFNGKQRRIPEIPKRLLEEAHAKGSARFYRSRDSGQLVLRGEVSYPLRGDWHKTFRLIESELNSILMHGRQAGLPRSALDKLGSFQVEFYWYNRRILTEIDGLGSRRDVQAEVSRWGGGLMVFRDGYRVNPYGGPDDDWLELDKRAFAAKGYKVNRNQIIGRVRISWKNRYLVEQTNREGLVDTVQKAALRLLLQHLLTSEFRPFLDAVDTELKSQETENLDTIDLKIERAKTEVEKAVLRLSREIPGRKREFDEIRDLLKQLAGYVNDAKDIAQQYEDDRAKFVYLAGIGLMVEFILHELGRSSAHALRILKDLDQSQVPSRELTVLGSLEDQLKTLQKRVDTLDPISTSRRQRKELFDLYEVVNDLVASHNGELERHNIRVTGNYFKKQKWNARAVKGMFVQIVENMLTNSFYWLKVQKRLDEDFRPKLSIDLDIESKTITFSDNGPGVAPEDRENIFQAFFTRKPPGEGKGLGLYICRELAEYHGWELYLSDAVDRKTGRLNHFLLELG